MDQDGQQLPVVRQLWEAVQDHHDEGGQHQDGVDAQVSAAGLQGSAVPRLAVAAETHGGDLQVGERDGDDRRAQQDHCVGQAVDVVQQDVFAGQLEQRRVVTEGVGHGKPAAGQADTEAHQDQHQHEDGGPGPHRQLHHHHSGHDGCVAQRLADGHVAVQGHDHEDGV